MDSRRPYAQCSTPTPDETGGAILLYRFCSKAQRSGLKPFVTLATIRKRRAGILAAVQLGINNARHTND